MDNPVSRCLKFAQKCRDHGGSLAFGVMKQHDSATIGIETCHYELQFLVGSHAVPIACPEVGAEHCDTALGQAIEQTRRRCKARKAEKWCVWLCRGGAVKRGVDGRDAAVDFRHGRGGTHMAEQRV